MKAVVSVFNQEKALLGAFSVIANLRMELFEALKAGEHLYFAIISITCSLLLADCRCPVPCRGWHGAAAGHGGGRGHGGGHRGLGVGQGAQPSRLGVAEPWI